MGRSSSTDATVAHLVSVNKKQRAALKTLEQRHARMAAQFAAALREYQELQQKHDDLADAFGHPCDFLLKAIPEHMRAPGFEETLDQWRAFMDEEISDGPELDCTDDDDRDGERQPGAPDSPEEHEAQRGAGDVEGPGAAAIADGGVAEQVPGGSDAQPS